ncbi:MAG: hypothetical protein IJ072_04070 [Oscillospiraceae bacterium]|nr:hypothetical protein [Oscillospiraceae bacterium]
MNIELTQKEYRRLLDMVYIGNWILNSTRQGDRLEDYDKLESKLFSHCIANNMPSLCEINGAVAVPSRAFIHGGIHEAIASYEDDVFFEILAQELALRDMSYEQIPEDDLEELNGRIEEYIEEFDENGVDNIVLEK